MGDVYKSAKDVFEKELSKIIDKGDMNPTNLEFSYKVIDILKDIETICAMKDSNYEDEYSNRGSYRNGYSRNYSYEMAPRMNQGGYSNNYSNNYSGSSMLVSKLHNLMNEASNDRERMMIQSWLNEVEK